MGIDMIVPILCGLLAGVISWLPYQLAFRKQRQGRKATVSAALVAVGVSFAIAMLSVLVAGLLMRDTLLMFVIPFVVAFLALVVTSALLFVREPRP